MTKDEYEQIRSALLVAHDKDIYFSYLKRQHNVEATRFHADRINNLYKSVLAELDKIDHDYTQRNP